jgi:hypothetical protein
MNYFTQNLLFMKLLNNKSRLLFCSLIIAAFFIPSYNNISGFGFINLVLQEAKTPGEITLTDAVVIIIPLLFIPISALIVFIRSALHLPTRKTFISCPLLFLFFFFAVLVFSAKNASADLSSPGNLLDMQIGFYIAATASLFLIFTKNGRKKKVRRAPSETMVTA